MSRNPANIFKQHQLKKNEEVTLVAGDFKMK
jgi:hypothetical protein